MTARLDPSTEAVIAEVLGDAEELVPFAAAVTLHLATSVPDRWTPREAAICVLEALGWGDDQENDEPFPLHRHPEILASFFQNADLLEPDRDTTAPIAKAVLNAMQRLGLDSHDGR